MPINNSSYLEKFKEAIEKKQLNLVKQMLYKFNHTLSSSAINNLALSLTRDDQDARGMRYYKSHLNEAMEAMQNTAYYS